MTFDTKNTLLLLVFIFSFLSSFCQNRILVGADQHEKYIPLLENKKIGVVAHKASILNRPKKIHLVDFLINQNINIKSIFAPEHGFYGKASDGQIINDIKDKSTGLNIISLYGKTKKPIPKDLKDIEIIVFDLQDVGARFYTYISTLQYVLEACSEENIKVIVLDRPNPNGHYIDGPVLEEKYKSFVGMHPIPIVHAMTIGEYAKMIIGEKWIEKKCDLTVIKMLNYNRKKIYELPIKPSPNLPNKKAVNLYPSLCLFEGTNVSIGRGTNQPFQHFGSPFLKFYSYSFQPKSGPGSKYPKHENKICYGKDLTNTPILNSINLEWLIETYDQSQNKEDFFISFFDKLAGTDKLRKQIISGKSWKEIKKSWEDDLKEFKNIRNKYLLYN